MNADVEAESARDGGIPSLNSTEIKPSIGVGTSDIKLLDKIKV